MAKRKLTIPLALVAGLGAGMAEPIGAFMAGDIKGGLDWLSANYTGYSPSQGNYNMTRLQRGLVPLLIGAVVHKFVGGAPLNVNRALAAAGVPILRI